MRKLTNEPENLNEAALACAARDGDSEAVMELLQSNWQWLKGLVYNVLKRPGEIDEVMQNICVLVLEKIHTLREPERFKPWLTTVARNASLAYRQKFCQKPLQLDELLAAQQPDLQAHRALDQLTRREQMERLHEAIFKLPEKYREVFILKHIQDMSYADIGEALGLTITTVQIRLVRARRMLQNDLSGKPNHKVPRT